MTDKVEIRTKHVSHCSAPSFANYTYVLFIKCKVITIISNVQTTQIISINDFLVKKINCNKKYQNQYEKVIV